MQLSAYSLRSDALLDSPSEEGSTNENRLGNEIDSAMSKRNTLDFNPTTPVCKKSPKRNNASITRVKMMLFNLATQKVPNFPCHVISENPEHSLSSQMI